MLSNGTYALNMLSVNTYVLQNAFECTVLFLFSHFTSFNFFFLSHSVNASNVGMSSSSFYAFHSIASKHMHRTLPRQYEITRVLSDMHVFRVCVCVCWIPFQIKQCAANKKKRRRDVVTISVSGLIITHSV